MPPTTPDNHVLTASDLPGTGWSADPQTDDESGAEPGDAGNSILASVLDGAIDDRDIVGSSESAVWRRSPHGFAYGVGMQFLGPDEARRAADLLISDVFVAALADAVGLGVDAPADVTFLGSVSRRVAAGPRVLRSIFRTTFTSGVSGGLVGVPIDMAVLQSGGDVIVLWIGDGVSGPKAVDRNSIVESVAERLSR